MARTFYDVLMISPRADREVISVVYRHLAKRYHPDREASPQAAGRMTELNEAYAVLSSVEDRARYDRRIGMLTVEPPVAPLSGDGRPTRAGGVNTTPAPGPYGEAGAPPPNPPASGRPLNFGRYRGWTLNQVNRYDPDYIEWLARTTQGRNHKQELDGLLRRAP
jgi:curved DNA-binding protein CbpA